MADMLSTTSSKTGTLPPTSPVLPPWGTKASRRSEQYAKICDTSSVLLGLRPRLLLPVYLPIQSLQEQVWDAYAHNAVMMQGIGVESAIHVC